MEEFDEIPSKDGPHHRNLIPHLHSKLEGPMKGGTTEAYDHHDALEDYGREKRR